MVYYELNEQFEGIEIYFDGIPETKLRNSLKIIAPNILKMIMMKL